MRPSPTKLVAISRLTRCSASLSSMPTARRAAEPGTCSKPTATVCFYGIPPANVANPAEIRVPLQAHFTNDDDWCTSALVDDFEAALKLAGKPARFFRYDAKHGFMNEQRPDAHQRQAAEPAWSRTLGFWGKHL